MSTAENKLTLLQMIIESEDGAFIKNLFQYARNLKKNNTFVDESDHIPEDIIKEIQLAMKELDNGTDKGISHDVMLEKFKKEFPNLKI